MKKQLISKRLNVNAGIMSWYVKELKALTKKMTDECAKEQKGLKTLGKYQKLGILASLALIPAGFGIGSFIDRIKNSNKIKNN